MKYRYIGGGDFINGLPTTDLDDGDLNGEQLAGLATGVRLGLYVLDDGVAAQPAIAAPQPAVKGKRDGKQSG